MSTGSGRDGVGQMCCHWSLAHAPMTTLELPISMARTVSVKIKVVYGLVQKLSWD